jgi:putative solute:sodium symporter small subunit
MTNTARLVFWARTKTITAWLLTVWLGVNLFVPWFARDLNALQAFGFPLGYWLAAEGCLLVYLLIILAYVIAMDRLEACYLRDAEAAAATASGPGHA